MNPPPPSPPAPRSGSITLNDVYYVLFRHKWMLIAFAVAGLLLAAVLYFATPKEYVSEAKLLVRYVMDTRSTAPSEKSPDFKSPDSRGETIINSEVEILTSLDLAAEVADIVGPEKILAALGGGSNRVNAAAVIANPKNLSVEVPRNSSIIRIRFQHPDPSIVQPVLSNLVSAYQSKHVAIHRGVDESFRGEVTAIEKKLGDAEKTLWSLKTNNGIISLEDSKKSLNDEISRIQSDLLVAEMELAERRATIDQLQPPKPDAAAAEIGVPADKVTEYKAICERLNVVRKRESEKSLTWGDQNPMLQALRSQIAEEVKKKSELEQKFPKLATLNIPLPAPTATSPDARAPSLDPVAEFAHARAIEAKINVLTNQLSRITRKAAEVEQAGPEIMRWQRTKEQLEASLRYYQALLAEATTGTDVQGHVTNLNLIQAPSNPVVVLSRKSKLMSGAFFGLIALGLAIAFGLELFLDPRIKRSSEVESKLHIPLFLAVPNMLRGVVDRATKSRRWRKKRKPEGTGEGLPTSPSTINHPPSSSLVEVLPQSVDSQLSTLNSQLAPYHAAIRDRLTMYFQARNMTHKPKLVGVTSSGRHAGVTTLASGLAASLSEMGSGNVLLVDMGIPNGMAHPFYKGKPVCPLNDALQGESRTEALVQEHLYLATARGSGETTGQTWAVVPAKFSAMMPRLKESDYDYIVFDLPPVSSTSPSAGLASMMDMTFFVVEAEKTNRETVKRSVALLAAAKANVACIMNKTRNYLPAWLHSEV